MEITKEQMLRHHDRLVQLLEHPGHPDQKVHGHRSLGVRIKKKEDRRNRNIAGYISVIDKEILAIKKEPDASEYEPELQSFGIIKKSLKSGDMAVAKREAKKLPAGYRKMLYPLTAIKRRYGTYGD